MYIVHKFDCRVVTLETRYTNQIKSNMMAQTAKVPFQQYIVHCAKYSRRKVQMQKCKQLKRSLRRVTKCTHVDTQKATLYLCQKYRQQKHTNTGSTNTQIQGAELGRIKGDADTWTHRTCNLLWSITKCTAVTTAPISR